MIRLAHSTPAMMQCTQEAINVEIEDSYDFRRR